MSQGSWKHRKKLLEKPKVAHCQRSGLCGGSIRDAASMKADAGSPPDCLGTRCFQGVSTRRAAILIRSSRSYILNVPGNSGECREFPVSPLSD